MVISRLNSSGFTLIEVLIAMVIMMVGLLGLLTSLNLAMKHNLMNQMRDEAVQIAEEQMTVLKVKPFDNISAIYSPKPVACRIRGFSMSYTVAKTIIAFSNSKQLVVNVSWVYRNTPMQHEIRTIKSQ